MQLYSIFLYESATFKLIFFLIPLNLTSVRHTRAALVRLHDRLSISLRKHARGSEIWKCNFRPIGVELGRGKGELLRGECSPPDARRIHESILGRALLLFIWWAASNMHLKLHFPTGSYKNRQDLAVAEQAKSAPLAHPFIRPYDQQTNRRTTHGHFPRDIQGIH